MIDNKTAIEEDVINSFDTVGETLLDSRISYLPSLDSESFKASCSFRFHYIICSFVRTFVVCSYFNKEIS